jgi:hypothetical protein
MSAFDPFSHVRKSVTSKSKGSVNFKNFMYIKFCSLLIVKKRSYLDFFIVK